MPKHDHDEIIHLCIERDPNNDERSRLSIEKEWCSVIKKEQSEVRQEDSDDFKTEENIPQKPMWSDENSNS